MKKNIEKVPEDRKSMIEEKEKIINIVGHFFNFNQLEQKGEGLKALTQNQMFSRLPVSLAQLKAGNNSEKLKNEIFMNTENSKTNEPHRFKLHLTDKLNLKNPNKNMAT